MSEPKSLTHNQLQWLVDDGAETTRFSLRGLDGGHLLAMLASLGLLRTATELFGDTLVRLNWTLYGGRWIAELTVHAAVEREEFLDALSEHLSRHEDSLAFVIEPDSPWNNLKDPSEKLRTIAEKELNENDSLDSRLTRFLSAFGSDILEDDDGNFLDTDFRTMRGSGHQHFLKFMRTLVDTTERDHLERALLSQWDYGDEKPSMRWAPEDDRRHALRAKNPSGDPIKTMRGANRLALEALPYFPVIPIATTVHTRGFLRDKEKYPPVVSWPIWEEPITSAELQSLLAHPELYEEQPQRERLDPLGIAEVYRCRRINTGGGRYRNFTPAEAVLGYAME